MENLLFNWVFCASVDVGRFLYLNKYASGLGSNNLSRILRLNFSYERIFEPTVLLLKKAARCHPFLAVVRCLFHNHLRLKRSSLPNVYLNYKFEISLLTSHLFFSLFNLRESPCVSSASVFGKSFCVENPFVSSAISVRGDTLGYTSAALQFHASDRHGNKFERKSISYLP